MALAREPESFVDTFETLEDPRIERARLHRLPEVRPVTLCGVIAGWARAGATLEGTLPAGAARVGAPRYRPFVNGVPSDDPLRRVFRALDPEAFSARFGQWAQGRYRAAEAGGAVRETSGARQIAIDGKTLRGSGEAGLGALHLVSAFAPEARVVLGQRAVKGGSATRSWRSRRCGRRSRRGGGQR